MEGDLKGSLSSHASRHPREGGRGLEGGSEQITWPRHGRLVLQLHSSSIPSHRPLPIETLVALPHHTCVLGKRYCGYLQGHRYLELQGSVVMYISLHGFLQLCLVRLPRLPMAWEERFREGRMAGPRAVDISRPLTVGSLKLWYRFYSPLLCCQLPLSLSLSLLQQQLCLWPVCVQSFRLPGLWSKNGQGTKRPSAIKGTDTRRGARTSVPETDQCVAPGRFQVPEFVCRSPSLCSPSLCAVPRPGWCFSQHPGTGRCHGIPELAPRGCA